MRPIEQFKGSILSLGGNESELRKIEEISKKIYGIALSSPIKDSIYTVNIEKREKPDLVADFSSEQNMSSLPDKRFDIVYFAHVPTGSFNYHKAFEIANRVLKDDGILLFVGGIIKDDKREGNDLYARDNVFDTAGALALAGFKQGKPIKALNVIEVSRGLAFWRKPEKLLEYVPTQGTDLIASKSLEPIDLEKKYMEIPLLKGIVSFLMQRNADRVSQEFTIRRNPT